jgi:hypothetical protein
MPERILIVAQDHGGHRLVYVRLLAQAVLDRGDQAILALTTDVIRSREYELHLKSTASRCAVTWLERIPLSPPSLGRLAREHHCGRVLVPDGDRFAIRLGITGWRSDATMVVLVTQDPQWNTDRQLAHRVRLGIKSLALARTQRLPGTRLLYLSDHFHAGRPARQAVAPDPVLFDASDRDPIELRRQFGLAEHLFWFLIAGHISARKNPAMVIRSLLPLAGRGVGLFICGTIEPAVRAELTPLLAQAQAARMPIVIDDRVQTERELNSAVQAVDCVVVAYSSDQPPSMMAKPVRAGRRVVVAGSASLRMWAQRLGIGLVGPLDQASLSDLLGRAVATPVPAPRQDLDHTAFAKAFLC